MGAEFSITATPKYDGAPLDECAQRRVIFHLANTLSEDQLVGRSGGTLTKESAERFVRARMRTGGIFWCESELEAVVMELGFDFINGLYMCLNVPPALLAFLAPHITSRNSVHAHVDGPAARKAMLELIASAKHHVHMQTYLFKADEAGEAVVAALCAAAERGVQVRLLIDKLMTFVEGKAFHKGFFERLQKRLEAAGAHVVSTSSETYTDVWWSVAKRDKLKAAGVPERFLAMQDFAQKAKSIDLNSVYHRKFAIVDGRRGYVASCNIAHEYLYDEPLDTAKASADKWHDGLAVVEGAVCRELQEVFAAAWLVLDGAAYDWSSAAYMPALEEFERPRVCQCCGKGKVRARVRRRDELLWLCRACLDEKQADMSSMGTIRLGAARKITDEAIAAEAHQVAVIFSFPGSELATGNVLRRLYAEWLKYGATLGKTIVTSPYIIDRQAFSAMGATPKETAGRLHVLTNTGNVSDHHSTGAAMSCHGRPAHDAGVKLYDVYDNRIFAHYKTATLDVGHGYTITGSYNLNSRSALHDFELCILVRGRDFHKQVAAVLEADIEHSRPLTLERDELHDSPHTKVACFAENVLSWVS
mmetsp:Transcript_42210/g.103880  ORF Transcript_42210/g.103880 Transcript_42210/m.103880 type:complete len:589 (+) Transcript_42210:138-1904(+)